MGFGRLVSGIVTRKSAEVVRLGERKVKLLRIQRRATKMSKRLKDIDTRGLGKMKTTKSLYLG